MAADEGKKSDGADEKRRKAPVPAGQILAVSLAFLLLFALVIAPRLDWSKLSSASSRRAAGKYDKALALIGSGRDEEAYALLNGLDYENSAELAGDCLFRIQKARLGSVTVGSTVRFGRYEQDNKLSNGAEEIEWIVLATEGNKALLISKYGLDAQDFNDEKSACANITWYNSQLRAWLNDAFYSAAFSPGHQEMILLSEVPAGPNPASKVSPGRATKDRVFLLSIDEAERCFDSDSARQCIATPYCYAQGAEKGPDGACWWWLRSPGVVESCPAVVIAGGAVFLNGFSSAHRPTLAVRPALWIDLG